MSNKRNIFDVFKRKSKSDYNDKILVNPLEKIEEQRKEMRETYMNLLLQRVQEYNQSYKDITGEENQTELEEEENGK